MPNKALILAAVLTAAVGVYLVLTIGRAIALIGTGDAVPMLLGAGVLVLPVLGAWILVGIWQSGLRVQRLASKLAAEGSLPDTSDLPRKPSGRVDRAAADAWFEQRRAELAENTDDWRAWYRIAHAYDVAGDRRRARQAMRKAIELEASAP